MAEYLKHSSLDDLNEEQARAVEHTDGPLLIVAGAGTGKTSVITRKLAYLVDRGLAKTEEILVLTYTDKAAGELEERIDMLLPYGYFDMWASTFHSFCEKILRLHAIDIGLPGNFKILSSSEQWIFLRRNLAKLELDYYRPLGSPSKFLHALISHFARLKDENISPQDYLEYASSLKLSSDSTDLPLALEEQRICEVAKAFYTYNQLLLDSNYLDFGDLIVQTMRLFNERPVILEKYRDQFKYILVDEFQDTNHAQYDLIKLLAYPKNNLTVVGDDEQSIYKFRGASLSNILEFRQDYPKARTSVLKKNYRSCGNILKLSHNFIKLNDPNRLEARFKDDASFPVDKELVPVVSGEARIEIIEEENKFSEASAVLRKIIEIKEQDEEATWSDFAILGRSNDAAQTFSSQLERARIPHQFLAARGLYLKPIIVDVVNFFKLLDDYHESPSVARLLLSPVFNISHRGLVELSLWAKRKGVSLYNSLLNAGYLKLSDSDLKGSSKLLSLVDRYSRLIKEARVEDIFFGFIEDSGYIDFLKGQEEGMARENISYLNQFLDRIKKFEELGRGGVKEFVELLDWESEAGETGSLKFNIEEGPDMVRVMTVHSAKGLEFKYVFVVQMADKRFPSIERGELIDIPDELVREILTEGDAHLEEERRLFYVAMTRAKKGLFFSWAHDYGGSRVKKPSRFLLELGFYKSKEKDRDKALMGIQHFENLRREPMTSEPVSDTARLVPGHVSFSQVKAFETCPLQYKFANILRIPVRGKAQFTFGQTMHTTMQKFFELHLLRKARKQEALFPGSKGLPLKSEEEIPVTLEELINIYKESWSDDWIGDEKTRKERYDEGVKMLKTFYEKLEEDGIPEIVSLERSFHFKLGQIKVIGKIDRVDRLRDGSLRLVDYKTGESKEKLSPEDRRQLLMYQAAMESVGEKVGELMYYYLDSSKSLSFLGSKEEIEEIKQNIVLTVENIKKSDFRATPSQWKCSYCDFKNICEFRAV